MAWSFSDWLMRAVARQLDSIQQTVLEVKQMEGDTLAKVNELKKDNDRVLGVLSQARQDLADLRTQIDQNASKAQMLDAVDAVIETIDAADEGASPEPASTGTGDTGNTGGTPTA